MNFLNSRAIRTQIPTAPLWLGLAGVLPFLWGAISAWNTDISRPIAGLARPRFFGARSTADLWRGDLIVYVRGALGVRV
jgi:hypothetical protein